VLYIALFIKEIYDKKQYIKLGVGGMIYTCDKCRFIFERVGEVDACPDCGKEDIREADETEKEEFQKKFKNHNLIADDV